MINPERPLFFDHPVAPSRGDLREPQPALDLPPLVSVIVAATGAEVPHETLESLRQQTLRRWELIVGDAGPSQLGQRSWHEITRYHDPRVRFLPGASPTPAAARSRGAAAASASALCFLADGDLLEPTALEKLFLAFACSDARQIFSSFSVRFGTDCGFFDDGHLLWRERIKKLEVPTQWLLMGKDFHDDIGGFDSSLADPEAWWAFWQSALERHCDLRVLPEYLHWYRDTALSATAADRRRRRFGRSSPEPAVSAAKPAAATAETAPLPVNPTVRSGPHVLVLQPYFLPGGSERALLQEVAALRSRGWRVTVIATERTYQLWLDRFARVTPDVFVLHHLLDPEGIWRRRPAEQYRDQWLRLLDYFLDSRACDVLLISNSVLGFASLPLLKTKRPNLPIVTLRHAADWPAPACDTDVMADLSIATSQRVAAKLVANGRPPERVAVHYTGIDLDTWTYQPLLRAQKRQALGIDPSMPLVLIASRMSWEKGADLALKVLRRLAEEQVAFEAVWVGTGELWEASRQFLIEARLTHRVRLLGTVDDPELHALFAAADVFLLTSRIEGIPIAALEALASGLPVVASAVDGLGELVDADCGFLVDLEATEDQVVEAFRDALGKLLSDSGLRRQMGRHGRELIEAQFDLRVASPRFEALLRQAIRLNAEAPLSSDPAATALFVLVLAASESLSWSALFDTKREADRLQGLLSIGSAAQQAQASPIVAAPPERHAPAAGELLWRIGRFAWRALPLSGKARFRLRAAILRSLRLEGPALGPDTAVLQLRWLLARLSPRWIWKGVKLLLRGETGILKQHVAAIVQHELNNPQLATVLSGPAAASAPELIQLEPWPPGQPLVSVVIPCFNNGTFAQDAVHSILAQTFQDFEILVVDGGSTSPVSLAALRALRAPKTRVFFRDGSRFVGDNRNYGISRARGKYICCLDTDDLLQPTYLEKALFLLEAHGYDLVSTAIRCFGTKTAVYLVKRYPTLADMMGMENHVPNCAVFRRDLWEAAGGFQDTGLGADYPHEDWRFWMRLIAMGARVANLVDEPLFLYRCHSTGSLATQNGTVLDIKTQGQKIRELNRDVLSEEALRLSDRARDRRIRAINPSVNLTRGMRRDGDPRTILIGLPFLILGGADRLVSQLVEHLAGAGYRVVIVTTLHIGPEHGDSTAWFESHTREIYHLPRFLEPHLWRDFVFHLFDTRAISLLWIIGSAFFYELLPTLRERHPELRVIDLLFNTIGHTANNRKYERHFDRIVVENREVASWLLAAGEAPARLTQIENGVDLTRYRPRAKSPDLLRRLRLPEQAFVVGFSGRMAEEKDPLACIEIADRLRSESSIFFVMTGTGPLADEVQSSLERKRLGDRVRYVGAVMDVAEYLALFDVLLLPSRLDGRPNVVLESLAMGVPVIATRVGALPELILEGRTGFLCAAGDVEQFVSHIRWLAGHLDECRAMGRAARAFAERHLDAAEMCRRYEALMDDLLATVDRAQQPAIHPPSDPRPPADPTPLAASRVRPRG